MEKHEYESHDGLVYQDGPESNNNNAANEAYCAAWARKITWVFIGAVVLFIGLMIWALASI